MVSRHKELQREACDLTEAEEQLDELIAKCNLQLRLLTEDPQNKKYPSASKEAPFQRRRSAFGCYNNNTTVAFCVYTSKSHSDHI